MTAAAKAIPLQRDVKPQLGFQESFLSSRADITIGGGAAGVGKTFALLLEPLRHLNNGKFGAVVFRRTYAQIEMEGGLWDKSTEMYPLFGARGREGRDWTFPSGMSVSFTHLQYEKNLYDHQGSEYALELFDELTHFTEKMFFYLLSRNRSTSGVRPYVMATCNPDPNSWVAKFISWWIDQETGFPIRDHIGKLRYMYRHESQIFWADSKAEILHMFPQLIDIAKQHGVAPEELIKSVTFIPGNIQDNRELLAKDPGYLANLLAQDPDERARLLDGNWKISLDKMMIAQYEKVERIFDNEISNLNAKRYITVDAARFGRDFLVIFVWSGWRVVWTVVLQASSTWDIMREIEQLRGKFAIPKDNVIVDQDGVGRNTVKLGRYRGFSGNDRPMVDRDPKTENKRRELLEYRNLKAQCVYRYLNRVNENEVQYIITKENCQVDGEFTTKIKIGSQLFDVKELLKQDLRSYRRIDSQAEGSIMRKDLESKELQKVILQGRSPDFGDASFMREALEMMPGKTGVRT